MKEQKELNSKLIYYLSLIGFFAIFSTTISKNPVLPLYAKALGATEILLGLISAFSPLAGILFSFPVGLLSDKIGKKKLLIISGVIFMISPLMYLFINNPIWLIPIRFFHGIATAILGPVISAIIISKYQNNKGEKLGIYSSSTLVGRTLAPLLGGFIISYFTTSNLPISNYKYVYITAFLLSIPVFLCILFLEKDKSSNKKVHIKDFYINLRYFLKNKRLLSTSLVEMASYFSYGVLETYLPIYLSKLEIPAYQIGIIFSLQIFSIAITKPFFGKLSDKIDKKKQILIGIMILGFSISLLGFFSSIIIESVIGIFFGLGLSFSTIATNSYIGEITKKDKLGSSLGLFSSLMDIGQSLGPLIAGFIISYFSFRLGFILCLVISILSGINFFFSNFNSFNTKKR
ncbi:MFS transporter [Candidatus Woesearchaeota archaeon]|jgi:MFS family permease|nr:MFS transporter [Candidatus Woesearchaeota archaeon]